ncbi:hypothetical protein LINPERHAP1_LOCUS36770 [Linum perenne]
MLRTIWLTLVIASPRGSTLSIFQTVPLVIFFVVIVWVSLNPE